MCRFERKCLRIGGLGRKAVTSDFFRIGPVYSRVALRLAVTGGLLGILADEPGFFFSNLSAVNLPILIRCGVVDFLAGRL